ncbi:Ig-like domain-containing protein, partial [uncultured Methanobrevibacter sp.]|uniref:Ig-like domain-containing protein n=1 Tax=uncultured Methanobrevibacter sp. TaxID=253161 RepID=UPI00262C42E3
TFAVSFLGDEYYNASFAVAKITVNPEPVKLTTAKKTYKANAKTKTLTATLTTSRSSPIAGKKISFTVNGKTYTGTTNSKGIATVKVSISKKGTYSFTAKFAGDDRYNAISIKDTLKLS